MRAELELEPCSRLEPSEMVLSPEEGREMRDFLCENGYCVIPGVRHSPRPTSCALHEPSSISQWPRLT